MKKLLNNIMILLVGFLSISFAFADTNSRDAVGNWVNIDDNTGKKKAVVSIEKKADGLLYGKIVKIFNQKNSDRKCEACTDDRRNKPMLGLEIIRGCKKVDNDWDWKEGTILDPENGKNYKLRMWTSKDGKKLNIRGYLGPFYRTQYWQRDELKVEEKVEESADQSNDMQDKNMQNGEKK